MKMKKVRPSHCGGKKKGGTARTHTMIVSAIKRNWKEKDLGKKRVAGRFMRGALKTPMNTGVLQTRKENDTVFGARLTGSQRYQEGRSKDCPGRKDKGPTKPHRATSLKNQPSTLTENAAPKVWRRSPKAKRGEKKGDQRTCEKWYFFLQRPGGSVPTRPLNTL